jgi:hypothetical protein
MALMAQSGGVETSEARSGLPEKQADGPAQRAQHVEIVIASVSEAIHFFAAQGKGWIASSLPPSLGQLRRTSRSSQ